MGDPRVRLAKTQSDLQTFTRHLLRDIQALERMLKEGWFETNEIRIGAEQEMCIVDSACKPAPKNLEVLERLNNPSFTTELAKFNIEANLTPEKFEGKCLSNTENQLLGLFDELHKVTKQMDISPVITGILPTIRKFDVNLDNLTPNERYYSLIQIINDLRGPYYELRLEGLEELNVLADSALIEACNTSFQVHLQTNPEDFVNKYNIAQAIAAPVMAISANSPMLFGKRLWHETRIALFRQSIDTRFATEHLRERSPRVTFGSKWLKGSIVDLYKEDITRFSIMFLSDIEEDVMKCLDEGITPKLRALNIHNSTVYRWNRPCYGISPNGKPHLRIENRILPAGPSVVDEMANTAFWLGLMNGFEEEYKDITKLMDFDDAKSNFLLSARAGLGAKFAWVNGRKVIDIELIKNELLPIAREGLRKANIAPEDINKYLGIIEARNESGYTGSRWMLNSYSELRRNSTKEETILAMTSAMIKNQTENKPVHQWKLASTDDIMIYNSENLLVEEFMTTDLFTVKKDDVPDFCGDMMDWQKIRYIPVEDSKGTLVGLVSSRILLRYYLNRSRNVLDDELRVEELMIKNPVVISPQATILEAMELMRKENIGCLPVVNKGNLVGILTESNFLAITQSLIRYIGRKKTNPEDKKSE